MREAHRDPLRLKHMHEAIVRIQSFMNGRTLSDLDNESLLFYGVVKNLEIIGEAAYKLTSEFKDSHQDTPWREIVGMRHILVHGYYQVKPNNVYDVFLNHLPILKSQLDDYLKEFNVQ